MDLGRFYREQGGRVLATVIRLVGDFELAEEAVQEAFAAALEQWPRSGAPDNPRAWLVSVARHKAIDQLRRGARFDARRTDLEAMAALEETEAPAKTAMIEDDRLRLIFTCCHPALAIEAQIALTLRTLCGLSTEEIARAFLVPVATMAQRLVRAKYKIRVAGIPYRVPPRELLAERLEAVLRTVYLVFNEGYAASSGGELVRRELCAEAIRLGRLLAELLPRPDVRALLALMLLHDARREARLGPDGELATLEEQDRRRWNHGQIAEGLALVDDALREEGAGFYSLQAAIAALHARAGRHEDTDWRQIAALYEVLCRRYPSPVMELNRAAALAMAEGPARGLGLLESLEAQGALDGYHLLPAARADLLRRLGRWDEAGVAYRRALALVRSEPERRFLERRLAKVSRGA